MSDKLTQYFLLTLASLLVIFFAYEVREVLSPLLIFILAVFLLYPISDNFYANRLVWICVILFIAWFAKTLSGLLAPFIIGFVLAYLFEPLIGLFMRLHRRITRSIAALIITLFGVGSVILAVVFITPLITAQLALLSNTLSDLPAQAEALIQDLMQHPLATQIGLNSKDLQDAVVEWLRHRSDDIGSFSANAVSAIASSFPQLLSAIIDIVLIPFLAYYFLSDLPAIKSTIRQLVPPQYRQSAQEYALLGGEIVRQYLRGQLIVVFILIAFYSVAFALIKLRYSFLIGIIYGVMSFVPYIGGIIAFLSSVLVAVFGENVAQTILLIAIIYAAGHALENFVLAPKIIGERVKLNPIVLFLAIFLFGYFFGFFGVLLAVPLSAFLVEVLRRYLAQREAAIAAAESRPEAQPEEEVKEF
ncbi:MAG: AI-2E family transporter [Chloroherpetonaceae bacterium]|nr:AI-2E family transporter [Chloroherpetonaceae bacterium]MCS7211591.1 AI-2E family transporter [Chloroherpetonaceae bacterium]MDW8019093.1 AI-2E family transporter [Chloroherpetonaceae bacterium]